MPPIGITHIGAERRDFNLLSANFGRVRSSFRHNDHAELCADRKTARKNCLDLGRGGIGADVVVRRFSAQQNIAHASTNQKGLVSFRTQCPANVLRESASVHGVIMRETRTAWKFGILRKALEIKPAAAEEAHPD